MRVKTLVTRHIIKGILLLKEKEWEYARYKTRNINNHNDSRKCQ